MNATTRPFTNDASYYGIDTSAGPVTRAATPGSALGPPSGQRIPNTEQQVQNVGLSNRRIPAPRRRGGNVAP